jgi:hypothetical protein
MRPQGGQPAALGEEDGGLARYLAHALCLRGAAAQDPCAAERYAQLGALVGEPGGREAALAARLVPPLLQAMGERRCRGRARRVWVEKGGGGDGGCGEAGGGW